MFNYNAKLMGIIGSILTIGAFLTMLVGFNNYVAKSSELAELNEIMLSKVTHVSERLTEHELRVERADIWQYIREVEKDFRAMYIEEYGERPSLDQLDGYIEDIDPEEYEIYIEAKERLEEIDEELERIKENSS